MNKFSRPLGDKQARSVTDPPSYFGVSMKGFSASSSIVLHQTHLWVFILEKFNLSLGKKHIYPQK